MKRTIAIVILLCTLCSPGFAVILFVLDAPQDDRDARTAVWGRPELQTLVTEYSNFLRIRPWPGKLDDVARIFGPVLDTATNWVGRGGNGSGPKLGHHPADLVLPIFANQGMAVSGLTSVDPSRNKRHTDLHAIGDIGYVEFYYNLDGQSVQTRGVYFRADKNFVPLKSTNDFPKRLEWDKAKFEALKKWFDAHLAPGEETKKLIGQLGKPVGTELTIEGTFEGGKNSWILVTKVNGEELAAPVRIATDNLDPFSPIPINTVCRFRGREITYIVQNQSDPKTGTTQQAAPGRHFDFKVTEILAPKGVKVSAEK